MRQVKPLYIKCESIEALTADLKSISEDFVTTNEEGEEVLKTHSHDWAIDYIGKMVNTPATLDEEGNVVTEATYYEGERANMNLVGDIIEEFEALKESGKLDNLPNGSCFVYPTSPKRVFG